MIAVTASITTTKYLNLLKGFWKDSTGNYYAKNNLFFFPQKPPVLITISLSHISRGNPFINYENFPQTMWQIKLYLLFVRPCICLPDCWYDNHPYTTQTKHSKLIKKCSWHVLHHHYYYNHQQHSHHHRNEFVRSLIVICKTFASNITPYSSPLLP